MTDLTILETTGRGDTVRELHLSHTGSRITPRELIERRVRGVPTPAAAGGDGGLRAAPGSSETDIDRRCTLAIEAFLSGSLNILVDGEPATELDEEIALAAVSEITFSSRIPLRLG